MKILMEHEKAIPSLIKKNTLLLAVIKTLIAAGFQIMPSLGSLIMLRFTNALTLVGLILSIGSVTRAIVSFPAGNMADSFGRRSVLFLGLILGGFGSILIYYAVVTNSLWGFIIGLVVNSLGLGSLQQITVAAIDMYPSSKKAEAFGYVMTGTSIGSIGAPILVWATNNYANSTGMDSLALPWLAAPILMLLGVVLVFQIRPDPLEIAEDLGKFYPKELIDQGKHVTDPSQIKFMELIKRFPLFVAISNSMLVSGVMIITTSFSSLILTKYGFGLTLISVAVTLHTIGMFGFSTIFGKMADRRGRKPMIFLGIFILGFSSLLSSQTKEYWTITLGLFLVGLGWSAVNVSVTALMGDTTPSFLMGRIIGFNQLVGGTSGLLIPILGGTIAQRYGFPAIGFASIALLLPILLLALRLQEISPGIYDHS
jgi:MFS family permease